MGRGPGEGLDGVEVLIGFFEVGWGWGRGRVLLRGRRRWRPWVVIVAGGEGGAFFFAGFAGVLLDGAGDAEVLEVEAAFAGGGGLLREDAARGGWSVAGEGRGWWTVGVAWWVDGFDGR